MSSFKDFSFMYSSKKMDKLRSKVCILKGFSCNQGREGRVFFCCCLSGSLKDASSCLIFNCKCLIHFKVESSIFLFSSRFRIDSTCLWSKLSYFCRFVQPQCLNSHQCVIYTSIATLHHQFCHQRELPERSICYGSYSFHHKIHIFHICTGTRLSSAILAGCSGRTWKPKPAPASWIL